MQPLQHEKTQCFTLRQPPQTHVPCNIPAAITMCFAACAHSCSHYNAICNRTLQNTIMEEPVVMSKRTARNRLTHDCSHFIEKKQSFVLRRPPQHKSHATFLQPFCTTSPSCHTFLSHCFPNSSHFSKASLPKVSTSLLTASLGHHFPWSPLP